MNVSDVGFLAGTARPRHYRRLARLLIAAAMLCAGPSSFAQAEPGFPERVEARVLYLVNELRSERGLKPLERDSRLDSAAEAFGKHMARTGVLEHTADGMTPAMRVKRRGYAYCVVSENIAYEYSSRGFSPDGLARNFVDGWRDSPTHRDNILDPLVTQTGLGIARNARGEFFAAQLFARPAAPGAGKRACPRR